MIKNSGLLLKLYEMSLSANGMVKAYLAALALWEAVCELERLVGAIDTLNEIRDVGKECLKFFGLLN